MNERPDGWVPAGGEIQVELPASERYEFAWWNPATGFDGNFEREGTTKGGIQKVSSPGKGDWALWLSRNGSPITSYARR